MKEEKEIDIFRALGHPLRRRILRFVAERGAVTYKELTKLEPKPGVLYHHLRLLGDLIYQDEKKQYRLTEKGRRAYEFLVTMFTEPHDERIHKILTPRWIFEYIEDRTALIFIIVLVISSSLWILAEDYIPVLLVILPGYRAHIIPVALLPVINWLASSLILSRAVRTLFGRNVRFADVAEKTTLSFILLNVYPVLHIILSSPIVRLAIVMVVQFFSLLLLVSSVSVAARVSLRTAGLLVILLHYISVLIALTLAHM